MESIRTLELLLDLNNVRLALDLDDAVHLGGVAHQLDRARVQHPLRRVAVLGEVVEEDVGDGEAAGGLYVRNSCLSGEPAEDILENGAKCVLPGSTGN